MNSLPTQPATSQMLHEPDALFPALTPPAFRDALPSPKLFVFWLILLIQFRTIPAAGADEFESKIQPLFQKHCYRCHNNREASGNFSVESVDAFFAFQSKTPDARISKVLLEVVTPSNGEARMPQDAPPLTNQELASIQQWLAKGAHWPPEIRLSPPEFTDLDWWSYNPIERPKIPKASSWALTPIDAFIEVKLREHDLAPSEEADRRTLIRRLTFDLLGLPPTPEAVAAFVDDRRPDAYEHLVDQLLSSPQYGERWARHWLDVVKYADTCGYDKDKLRVNAWPYRDYVVRSFNEDKSYRRFVREQLAGDVLFPNTPDGILGLGFIAAGPWDHIGHVEVPETKIDGKVARNLDRDDMVSNTMNAFASITIQCARCHNHKFDPVTQDHYYGLQSIFAAVDRAERVYAQDPAVVSLSEQLRQTIDENQGKLDAIEEAIAHEGGERLIRLHETIAKLSQDVSKPIEHGYHSAIAKRQDTEKWVELKFPAARDISAIELYPCHDDFAGIGAGFGFPVRFRVEVLAKDKWQTLLDQTKADFPRPSYEPVVAKKMLTTSRIRVTATKLAERKNDFNFALAEIRVLSAAGEPISHLGQISSKDSIESAPRWRKTNLIDGIWPRHPDAAKQIELSASIRSRNELLQQLNSAARFQARQVAKTNIAQAKRELDALDAGKVVYAAATKFKPQGNFKPTEGKLRTIKVLHRGNVQQPLQEAQPGFIPLPYDRQPQIPAGMDDGQRRAALANWLTDDQQPLVWRSIANRIWQYHFGKAIVDTPNDFGRMGSQPTHPELLDWLAAEIRSTRSIKHLHRLIVTSKVYRQACTHRPQAESIDKENRLLWRMPRRRLEAEEIRDSILAVSGVLRNEMGGPGFFLFELEKTDHSPHYEYHKFDPSNADSHRRSIYRFIVRSQPDPWMTTLDCADSSQSTPTRSETLTPGQSLALLNNAFNLEMASRFAKRLQAAKPDLASQIRLGVELCLQRKPKEETLISLVNYAERHGLENACRMLFNLNEFIFID